MWDLILLCILHGSAGMCPPHTSSYIYRHVKKNYFLPFCLTIGQFFISLWPVIFWTIESSLMKFNQIIILRRIFHDFENSMMCGCGSRGKFTFLPWTFIWSRYYVGTSNLFNHWIVFNKIYIRYFENSRVCGCGVVGIEVILIFLYIFILREDEVHISSHQVYIHECP